jgi:hypothetical protein
MLIKNRLLIFFFFSMMYSGALLAMSAQEVKYKCRKETAGIYGDELTQMYDECLRQHRYARVYSFTKRSLFDYDVITFSEIEKQERAIAKDRAEQQKQIKRTGWPYYIRETVNGHIYVGGTLVTDKNGYLLPGVQNHLTVQSARTTAEKNGLKDPLGDIPQNLSANSSINWPSHIRNWNSGGWTVGGTDVTDGLGNLVPGIENVLGVQGARREAQRLKLPDPLADLPARPGQKHPGPFID